MILFLFSGSKRSLSLNVFSISIGAPLGVVVVVLNRSRGAVSEAALVLLNRAQYDLASVVYFS